MPAGQDPADPEAGESVNPYAAPPGRDQTPLPLRIWRACCRARRAYIQGMRDDGMTWSDQLWAVILLGVVVMCLSFVALFTMAHLTWL